MKSFIVALGVIAATLAFTDTASARPRGSYGRGYSGSYGQSYNGYRGRSYSGRSAYYGRNYYPGSYGRNYSRGYYVPSYYGVPYGYSSGYAPGSVVPYQAYPFMYSY